MAIIRPKDTGRKRQMVGCVGEGVGMSVPVSVATVCFKSLCSKSV